MEQLAEFGDIKIALCEGFKACDRALKNMELEEFADLKESLIQEFSLEQILNSTSSMLRKVANSAAFMYSVRNEVCKEILRMQLAKKASSSSDNRNGGNSGKKKDDGPLVGLFVGSAASSIVFTDEIIYVANIGDSRCIASINGSSRCLTRDHRPVLKKERNRIVESGNRVSKGRVNGGLRMSRAFGNFALKRAKVRESCQAVIVEPFLCAMENNVDLEFIVIASSGVWSYMDNGAIMDFVRRRSHLPIPDVCQQLFETILTNNNPQAGLDNMTMVIIRNDSKVIKLQKAEIELSSSVETEEKETKKGGNKKHDAKKSGVKKEAKKLESEKSEAPKSKRLRK